MPDIKKNRPKQTVLRQKSNVPLYWGLKSKNEQYFQIASVFKLAGQNNSRLSEEWMHSILSGTGKYQKYIRPENTGNYA
ncbi:MAG: hypothetical protein LC657_12535 [Desulfobacteraceae bacterium]|nr:hypothetical protein [Desulfobacteraceae bacterium]